MPEQGAQARSRTCAHTRHARYLLQTPGPAGHTWSPHGDTARTRRNCSAPGGRRHRWDTGTCSGCVRRAAWLYGGGWRSAGRTRDLSGSAVHAWALPRGTTALGLPTEQGQCLRAACLGQGGYVMLPPARLLQPRDKLLQAPHPRLSPPSDRFLGAAYPEEWAPGSCLGSRWC